MSYKSILISASVVVLLLLGILAVYSPQVAGLMGTPRVMQAADEFTYVTDLDFWERTPRERTVEAIAHFDLQHDLNNVPLQVGSWTGVDDPETNQEVTILLDPEQYVQRFYADDQGRTLWLTMVGGRSSRPFHAPDICYDADGWQYDLGSHATPLEGGGEIYGLWLDASKKFQDDEPPAQHVVYYFYLFPDDRRDQADGIVLFKLTSGRYGSLEETLQMHESFASAFFSAASVPSETAQRAN